MHCNKNGKFILIPPKVRDVFGARAGTLHPVFLDARLPASSPWPLRSLPLSASWRYSDNDSTTFASLSFLRGFLNERDNLLQHLFLRWYPSCHHFECYRNSYVLLRSLSRSLHLYQDGLELHKRCRWGSSRIYVLSTQVQICCGKIERQRACIHFARIRIRRNS